MEYKIKALYIVKIAEFITWPDFHLREQVTICGQASDPVIEQLNQVTDKVIQSRPFIVLNTSSDFSQCDILYLSGNTDISKISNQPILVISSQEGSAQKGVMVEFYLDDNKVRIKVNLQSFKQAQLKLSSKLFNLVTLVSGDGNND